jgi:hypothetical protein
VPASQAASSSSQQRAATAVPTLFGLNVGLFALLVNATIVLVGDAIGKRAARRLAVET